MDELIQLLESKGLNAEQAQMAAETAIAFIKEKVPPQFQGYVDQLLSAGGLGSMLGGFKF